MSAAGPEVHVASGGRLQIPGKNRAGLGSGFPIVYSKEECPANSGIDKPTGMPRNCWIFT